MSLTPDNRQTPGPDTPRLVEIRPKPGGYVVAVDGVDVAPSLVEFHVTATNPKDLPVVTLVSRRPVDVAIAAKVQVVPAEVPEFAELLVDFLGKIDVAELEKAALNRHDLTGERGALTRAMLTQLQEWARGA